MRDVRCGRGVTVASAAAPPVLGTDGVTLESTDEVILDPVGVVPFCALAMLRPPSASPRASAPAASIAALFFFMVQTCFRLVRYISVRWSDGRADERLMR
jgi:hypothetical protein